MSDEDPLSNENQIIAQRIYSVDNDGVTHVSYTWVSRCTCIYIGKHCWVWSSWRNTSLTILYGYTSQTGVK